MKRMLLTLVMLLFSVGVMAKPQALTWTLPTTDCDGEVMPASELVEVQIIYDTAPMPMPSDASGSCGVPPDPDKPATATAVTVAASVTGTEVNLQPGVGYYFRARISRSDGQGGVLWSNWSLEIFKVVPRGRPERLELF